MKKPLFDSLNTSTSSTSHLDKVYISNAEQHIAAVAAAHDMLAFLRTSTNNLAYHEERHDSPFYRGLSLCLGAVQEQLAEGLAEVSEK